MSIQNSLQEFEDLIFRVIHANNSLFNGFKQYIHIGSINMPTTY